MVGKVFCLVMLWQNPARRDKPWNYMPPEFQRYTKLNLATGYLYGHVENVWGIPFPKRMEWKDCFLSELFQEQVSDYKLTTCWLIDWTTNVTTNKKIDYKLIDKTWLEADLMSGNDYKLVDRWTLFSFFFFFFFFFGWLQQIGWPQTKYTWAPKWQVDYKLLSWLIDMSAIKNKNTHEQHNWPASFKVNYKAWLQFDCWPQGWLTDHKIDYNLIADHKLMIDHYNF